MEIKRRFLGLDEKHMMFFEVFQEHNDKCRELIGKDYAKVTISRFDTCLRYFKEMALKEYHLKDIPNERNKSCYHSGLHSFPESKEGFTGKYGNPLHESGEENHQYGTSK